MREERAKDKSRGVNSATFFVNILPSVRDWTWKAFIWHLELASVMLVN